MALDRNISNAHPILQDAWHYAKREWEKWHDDTALLLNEVSRPLKVQRAYYAQGRQPLVVINELREMAGLAPIGAAEAKRIVTKLVPGKSKHGLKPSAAIDIYVMVEGKISNDLQLYKALADIIRDRQPSVVWGGDWDSDGESKDEQFLDLVHFEI